MFKSYFNTIIALTFGLFFNVTGFAQQKEAKIKFRSQYTEVDKKIGKGTQRLIGNVVFNHAGSEMYCDSAYFYSKKNSLDAYNDVYINQGDTLHVYGDFLNYNGNTKHAIIKGNVRLINKETTLTTDELEYDLGSNVGYYTKHGFIVNQQNTLESEVGHYYTRKKRIHFRDSVIIINPDYKIYSDTLQYDTELGIAYFFGPTNIIGDSSHIYCEKGWYDTKNDLTELEDDAWILNEEQKIKGDYIYYNKINGEGIAKKYVELYDFEQDVILTGNDSRYNELTEYAFMTDSAQFIQISDMDSLFLHADSIITYPDTSGQKVVIAYYNVKFYRSNAQGMCDSMVYTFSDSTVRLYGQPVLWTEEKQMSADFIEVITKNSAIYKMNLFSSSFIAEKKDTIGFDQLKGRNMVCHFNKGELYKIDVNGNSQTVYYPLDGEEIIGVNVSKCSDMKISLADGKVKKINFYSNPVSVLYPLESAPENELMLKGFDWLEFERPKHKLDIFK